ncbi:hypothetical protein [Nocardia sp. NPDC059228]|uniref:hypothetical protein n=1 Tax=Nocardia sp. NPDC059228 TaxID=3346777 RepID=UPI0036BF9CF4
MSDADDDHCRSPLRAARMFQQTNVEHCAGLQGRAVWRDIPDADETAKTQRPGGSWRMWHPTAEETAGAVHVLCACAEPSAERSVAGGLRRSHIFLPIAMTPGRPIRREPHCGTTKILDRRLESSVCIH